ITLYFKRTITVVNVEAIEGSRTATCDRVVQYFNIVGIIGIKAVVVWAGKSVTRKLVVRTQRTAWCTTAGPVHPIRTILERVVPYNVIISAAQRTAVYSGFTRTGGCPAAARQYTVLNNII